MSALLLGLLLAPVTAGPAAAERAFRAGVSSAGISPREFPVIVSGGFLARRVDRASGSLEARAVVLDDGDNRIVIAVADSLMLPRELLDEVKQAASRTTGIPADHMLISATHTHSAPPVMGALGTDANAGYIDLVRGQLVKVIEQAAAGLRPARVGWAVVQAPEYTHCRRWILRPDKLRKDPFGELTVRAHMHPGYQNPDFVGPAGPVDPDLTVLAVQSRTGDPIAVVANYSMHYVGSTDGVSPDYYGPFVEKMRRLLGVRDEDAGFVAMMSQGTSGDQHWMDYSQPKREMDPETYAGALAKKAFEAYRKITYREWVPLGMREERLTLSRRLPDEQRLSWARKILAAASEQEPKNQTEVYAREQILIAGEPKREIKLQAARIGDLGVTALPNEVFAITGLKIKAQSPLEPTFNIELANGADGYIPPPEQHQLGGYTTWPARTAGLEVNAEPKIVAAVLGLLEEVSGKRRRPLRELHGAYAKAVLAARPLAYWRGGEIAGRVALDASGNNHPADYEGGVALYLEGPSSAAFSAGGINRAPHYAGGRMKARLSGLGDRYAVALWFFNGLPADARPLTGRLLSVGGDHLSIGGTARAPGRLLASNGEQVLEGTTRLAPETWNFVVLCRDGTRVSLYLNGNPVPEASGVLLGAGAAGEILVGGGNDTAASFEGRVDEVAVFDRPLPPAQIARFYRLTGRRSVGAFHGAEAPRILPPA